jgi:hypothetical protein
MRPAIILLTFIFAGCATKVDISGMVVDNRNHLPVQGVKVRTIVDIVNNQMKMAEAVSTKDGSFRLQFKTYRTVPNQIPVELSKIGYQTNKYDLRVQSKTETVSGAAQQTVDNSDTLLKVSKEQYSLSYPKSWTIDTSKMFGMDLLLRSPKTDSLDDFIENLNVFVQALHGQNYNLAKMGQESETQIKNMVTDVKIIESKLDSTTSQPYYILKYSGRQGKFLLTTIQHYYLKDEVGYALTFTIKNGKETDYVPLSEKMFSSFKFH